MVSWLLFVHVLSAMVWLGGGLTLMLAGFRARSSSRPEAVAEFAGTVPFVGLRVLMPAVVLLLVTGVWQVLASSAWSFSQLWVRLALGLFVLAFLVGAIYLSRVGIGLARATAGNQSDLPVHDQSPRAGSTWRAISSSEAVLCSIGMPGGRAQKISSS